MPKRKRAVKKKEGLFLPATLLVIILSISGYSFGPLLTASDRIIPGQQKQIVFIAAAVVACVLVSVGLAIIVNKKARKSAYRIVVGLALMALAVHSLVWAGLLYFVRN